MSANQFNTDPLIVQSFRESVASLLEVPKINVNNIVASETASDRRQLMHQRMLETTSCSVSYKVKVESEAAMKTMKDKMKTISNTKFTIEMKKNMEKNQVKSVSFSNISSDTTSNEPKDVVTHGPTNSNDIDNNNNNGGSTGYISVSYHYYVLLIVLCFLLCFVNMCTCCCLWRKDRTIIVDNKSSPSSDKTFATNNVYLEQLELANSVTQSSEGVELSTVQVVGSVEEQQEKKKTNGRKRGDSVEKQKKKKMNARKNRIKRDDASLKKNVEKVKKSFGQLQARNSLTNHSHPNNSNPLYVSSSSVKATPDKKRPSFTKVEDDQGNAYYHCSITDTSQWERPEESLIVKEDEIVRDGPDKKRPSFREVEDDQGNAYYHCSITDTSQWERPEESMIVKE